MGKKITARKNYVAGADRNIAAQLAEAVGGVTQEAFDQYLKPRGRPRDSIKDQLRKAQVKAGNAAFLAMTRRFDETRSGKPSYRVGDPQITGRYSGGKLYRAVHNKDMHVRTTATSVAFFNSAWMDAQAPQWHRHSFGAGYSNTNAVTPMVAKNGKAIPGTERLERLGHAKKFSLPDGPGSYYRIGAEIHVTPNPAATLDRTNIDPGAFNAPLKNLQIFPRGWVQAGVSEMNRVYPGYLTDVVKDFLEP